MLLEASMRSALIGARLDHICLSSPAPDNLASFYGSALDMTVEARADCHLAFGKGRKLLFTQGAAKGAPFSAYALGDESALAHYRETLIDRGVNIEPSPSQLFDEQAFGVRDPDGNLVLFGVAMRPFSFIGQTARRTARLQHFVTASDDIDRVASFYSEKLGFTVADEVTDDAGGLRAIFLRTDEEHHSRAIFRADEKRLDHHCYETDDWNAIGAWADHMGDRHIPLKWGPGRHGPGHNLFFMIHDPDGNWIEMSAELDILPESAPAGKWRHEARTLNSWGQAFLRS